MDKPFKTIDQQIELLESRGVSTDEDTRSILMREGYYPIVNGYKAPFIDKEATREAGDDRYFNGTRFSDMHELFLFDRDLREATFHYLLRIEAMVRSICSYTFAEAHRSADDYLKQECFASEDEYRAFGLNRYTYNYQKLHNTLFNKASSDERMFIKHYREKHGWVPLWVLSKDLTFGNIEHFFNLMKPEEQKTVCRRIVQATDRIGSKMGFLSPRETRVSLDTLVKARNMCAHDERMYCASIGGRKNVNYLGLMSTMARFLTRDDFDKLLDSVLKTVGRASKNSGVVAHILNMMGFGRLKKEIASAKGRAEV